MVLTLTPLSLAQRKSADADWEHAQEIHRFSRRSKRMSVEKAAWSALAAGLMAEEPMLRLQSQARGQSNCSIALSIPSSKK